MHMTSAFWHLTTQAEMAARAAVGLLLLVAGSALGAKSHHGSNVPAACSALLRLQHNYTLDDLTLDQALLNPGGASCGFSAFLEKLLLHPPRGRPINVVVHGGSFSVGLGLNPPESLYFTRLIQVLQQLNPAVRVVGTNSAIGSSSPSFGLLCAGPLMPKDEDVDLVLVEYNPNMDFANHAVGPTTEQMMYERFIRRMLQWRGSPAVVFVQMLFPVIVEWADKRQMHFYSSTEDSMAVMSQYYSLPVVSMRNALYLKQKELEPGFGLEMRQSDHWHLSELGHTYVTDMMTWLIQTVLEQQCIRTRMAAAKAGMQSLSRKADSSAKTASGPGTRQVANAVLNNTSIMAKQPPLRPPMLAPTITGEDPQKYKMCVLASDLATYVTSHANWNYQSDDRHGRKFGFISTTAGSMLDLAVPRPADTDPSTALVLYVSFMRSYTDMGSVDVTCTANCSCVSTHINGAWETHASVTKLHPIEIRDFVGSHCSMRITHAGGPSPSAKFKLSGFMLVTRDDLMNAEHADLFGHYTANEAVGPIQVHAGQASTV